MIKLLTKLALFLVTFTSFSQVGIIKDKDGYVNVRDQPNTKTSKVLYTFKSEKLVWIDQMRDEVDNWYFVWDLKDEHVAGYIHKSRVKTFNELGMIPVVEKSENQMVLKDATAEIKIRTQDFEENQHQIYRDKQGFVKKIDGGHPWGIDGGVPRNEYSSIEVVLKGNKFEINKEKYLKDLFEPSMYRVEAYYSEKEEILYLSSSNSDGAGSYEVVFAITNENSIEKFTLIPF